MNLKPITCQEVETMEEIDIFSFENWSVNYEWYWVIEFCACAHTSDYKTERVTIFLEIFGYYCITKVLWENSYIDIRQFLFSPTAWYIYYIVQQIQN